MLPSACWSASGATASRCWAWPRPSGSVRILRPVHRARTDRRPDLLAHPTAHKWQSLLLAPLTAAGAAPLRPRFHTPTFLHTLTAALRPLQTPHFFTAAHPELPLTLVRISLHTPHTPPAYPVRGKSFWLAFPAGADHVFTTLGAPNKDGLREVVESGLALAVSRPGCRFNIKPGRLTAKTLSSLVAHRGAEAGKAGGMSGAWAVYTTGFEDSPIAMARETTALEPPAKLDEVAERANKRRKMVAAAFGDTGVGDGAALESVYFELQDKVGGWRPTIGVRLEGEHVFAGVRQGAEAEDGGWTLEKLPGWMRGEVGVTMGVVKDGNNINQAGKPQRR